MSKLIYPMESGEAFELFTILADSLDVAFVARFLITSLPARLPMDLSGIPAPNEEYCRNTFKRSVVAVISEVLRSKRIELADALDSYLIGSKESREVVEECIPKSEMAAWAKNWDAKRRYSLRDVKTMAHELAEDIRSGKWGVV